MIDIQTLILDDDGVFPNSRLPIVVYPQNPSAGSIPEAMDFESVFAKNGWRPSWRNGIYDYHHYHSTAHELLGCYEGTAVILFGGPTGVKVELKAGDAVVIPAGVSHKRLSCSAHFAVTAAYPKGQSPDIQYGRAGERPGVDLIIAELPMPSADPFEGEDGPLISAWRIDT